MKVGVDPLRAVAPVLAILAVNDVLCVAVLWMAAIWVLDPTNAHSIEFFARVKSDGSNRDRVTPASDLTKDETVLRGGARQGECKGSEVAVRLSTQATHMCASWTTADQETAHATETQKAGYGIKNDLLVALANLVDQ